ncbi:hypothetical protein E5356_05965 [Bacteroides acidifaciens]|jgi:hypothetical protein|uniref:Uncharacterized protein n=1 Tax=Bacteroides acidifaciens TaxID=85831 RepID=A0A4S2AYY3_9BACE|nr:hypothetical protein E5356_05965 [Bacteroides acidifaciens]
MIGDETFLPLLLISGRGEGNLVQNLEVNKVLKYKESACFNCLVSVLCGLLEKMCDFVWLF